MYPEADIPRSVALDEAGDAAKHLEIGRKLARLREEGVLVMGSGSFRTISARCRSMPPGQPTRPDHRVHRLDGEDARSRRLAVTRRLGGEGAARAQNHPTPEHFMPPFVAAGAGGKAELLHDSVHHGILAMHAFAFH